MRLLAIKWVGVLSVAERNSTSLHYIANGERDIHFFILNAKGTDTHDFTKKKEEISFFERAEKISVKN